jgi:hypothetical protein
MIVKTLYQNRMSIYLYICVIIYISVFFYKKYDCKNKFFLKKKNIKIACPYIYVIERLKN